MNPASFAFRILKTALGLIVVCGGFILEAKSGVWINDSVSYDPPPNFGAVKLRNDPGDNPFSGDGPGIEFLYRSQVPASVILRYGIVGFSIAPGKRFILNPVTTNDLKRLIEEQVSKKYLGNPSANHTTISGFPAVTLTGTNAIANSPISFLQTSWVQVRSNYVLKIGLAAANEELLRQLQESLGTIRINPQAFFDSLKPKEPKITRIECDRIIAGFVPDDGQEVPAYILKGRQQTWTIISGLHFDQEAENQVFNGVAHALQQLRATPARPDKERRVSVTLARYGDDPTAVQKNIKFHIADVAPSVSPQPRHLRDDYGLASLLASKISTNPPPVNFRKVQELQFPFILVIEERDDRR